MTNNRNFLQFVGIFMKWIERYSKRGIIVNDLSARADELIEAYSHGMKETRFICAFAFSLTANCR